MKKVYQAPEMNAFLDVNEDILTTSFAGAFWGEDDQLEV